MWFLFLLLTSPHLFICLFVDQRWFENRRRADRRKGRLCRSCFFFKAPVVDHQHDQNVHLNRPCVTYWKSLQNNNNISLTVPAGPTGLNGSGTDRGAIESGVNQQPDGSAVHPGIVYTANSFVTCEVWEEEEEEFCTSRKRWRNMESGTFYYYSFFLFIRSQWNGTVAIMLRAATYHRPHSMVMELQITGRSPWIWAYRTFVSLRSPGRASFTILTPPTHLRRMFLSLLRRWAWIFLLRFYSEVWSN